MNETRGVHSATESTSSMRAAFAALYEKHMPGVYQYVLYRVGDVPTAEDLTSTVFEKALYSFHRYRSEQASFPTWLMSIARNTLIDYFRVQGKRKHMPLEAANDIAADDPLPDEEATHKEELQRLRLCLSGLSQQEQEIISFKFGAGVTNRSIAGLLSLSESNVGVTLYRAVRKLRECFRKWQNGQG
ncbi:MAG: sigma-70 family RNA polymerase sigma factor [Chloroflexi bacterium]|nr:sigma-70 family RNA polymerase sigma factor [Chloroflexota bacterium]